MLAGRGISQFSGVSHNSGRGAGVGDLADDFDGGLGLPEGREKLRVVFEAGDRMREQAFEPARILRFGVRQSSTLAR